MTNDFTTLTDAQLKELIVTIEGELVAREKKRKKETAAKIRHLAEAAGLAVTVKDKVQKRRGRPPKNTSQ